MSTFSVEDFREAQKRAIKVGEDKAFRDLWAYRSRAQLHFIGKRAHAGRHHGLSARCARTHYQARRKVQDLANQRNRRFFDTPL